MKFLVLITDVLTHLLFSRTRETRVFLLIMMKITVMTEFIEPVLWAGRHHARGLICTTPGEGDSQKTA